MREIKHSIELPAEEWDKIKQGAKKPGRPRTMTEEHANILEQKLDRILDILMMTEESTDDEPKQVVNEILEPCPFCGGNPLYIVDPLDGIYITCPRCRVRTPGYFDNRVNQIPNAIVLARKTWNARFVRSNTLAENLEEIRHE